MTERATQSESVKLFELISQVMMKPPHLDSKFH